MFICVCLGEMMKLEMMMLGSDRKWCDQMVVVECVYVWVYECVCVYECMCVYESMYVCVSEWVSELVKMVWRFPKRVYYRWIEMSVRKSSKVVETKKNPTSLTIQRFWRA